LEILAFPIQLDTGSSDVWVKTPFPLEFMNATNISTNLTFGIGEVSGSIAFADMSLGSHEVPSQGNAYIFLLLANSSFLLNARDSDLECDSSFPV
jgi:hypothetical protein